MQYFHPGCMRLDIEEKWARPCGHGFSLFIKLYTLGEDSPYKTFIKTPDL